VPIPLSSSTVSPRYYHHQSRLDTPITL
jgi:hypothetical protein